MYIYVNIYVNVNIYKCKCQNVNIYICQNVNIYIRSCSKIENIVKSKKMPKNAPFFPKYEQVWRLNQDNHFLSLKA